MDERTKELNRIGDLLKNAFDGRYKNSLLSTHQKPVSVVPNRDFALKQFEFAKVAKMPISQTQIEKPADLDLYWTAPTIDLIRKLVKEREQYKQNSELVNKQLVSESSDGAKDAEIVQLRQEIATLTQQNANFKQIVKDDGIEKIKTQIENAKLSTELKECNDNVGKCNDSVGKCNEDLGKCDEDLGKCNEDRVKYNEEANEGAKWITELEEELQNKNAEFDQLKTSNKLVEQENKFKLEKAQMDIMFGMKIDLMKKQFEQNIANISNSSNADLVKQINDLTTEKQGYEQSIEETKQRYEQSIENFNEIIRNVEENNAKLIEENAKLIQSQNTNETQKQAISQANPDKAKLAQLQTRVINLTQELLIVKMNADLQKQKNANYKYVPQTYEEANESDMFDGLIVQGNLDLNMKGGAPKQKLSMKGGARRLYDDATQIVFKKETADKLRDQMIEYQARFASLKAEIDVLKSSSTTTNDDQLKELILKLALLKTVYANQHKEMISAQIANAANQGIALKLQASLTNPNAIADLTRENASLKSEIVDLTNAKAGLGSAKATPESEIASLKTENAGLESENASLKTENAGLANENASLKTENAGLANANANLKGENAGLANENANLKGENAGLTNAKAGLEAEKANLTSANAGLTNANAGLTNAKATLEVENTNLTNENAGLKTTNANLTNRLNATSTASGMSTAISTANATLPRNPKVFISDNGRVMFSEHK